jgi:hypothetical protein
MNAEGEAFGLPLPHTGNESDARSLAGRLRGRWRPCR